jgi:wyosine [tRNA(Phe)-imidazoG37] synthetase (radical SAM superfamily)
MPTTPELTTTQHSRDAAGMTYVYPVVSRRAGGVSVGVNLNPNNACNWRCAYCQVPDLQRGAAPEIDLILLEQELTTMLSSIVNGDFMQTSVPENMRVLHDIAISGNGEPTSAKVFAEVVTVIARVMAVFDLVGKIKLVLISNGSLMDKPYVQAGLREMAAVGGEVWFKVDSATREGLRRINDTEITPARMLTNLQMAAQLCPTWLQTCVFAMDNEPPSEAEQAAYLDFIQQALASGVKLQGVLLYGIARDSQQPEAARLAALPRAWLDEFAARIVVGGVQVKVSV